MSQRSNDGVPRWVKVLGIIAILLILLVAVAFVADVGGPHGPDRHVPSGDDVGTASHNFAALLPVELGVHTQLAEYWMLQPAP